MKHLNGASKFTQMFQGILTTPKRTSNGEHQRKNNGNAQERQIQFEAHIETIKEIGNHNGDGHCEIRSKIYYGKIESDMDWLIGYIC